MRKILASFYAIGLLCLAPVHAGDKQEPKLTEAQIRCVAEAYATAKDLMAGGYQITHATYVSATGTWMVAFRKQTLVMGEGSFLLAIDDRNPTHIEIRGGL